MSVDIRWLKKQGIYSGNYRKIFSAHPADYPKPVRALVDIISQRIRDGRTQNFENWRTYAAIDYAYEVPFSQVTPTLLNHIFSQNLNHEQTLEAVKAWGLSEENLFLDVPVPGGNGKMTKMPNPPVFFQIFIPLVKAYLAIREAKIFNERNTSPLLQYKPLKETTRNELLCEIETDIIQTIATNYGYSAVLRAAIHQALKYGIMIAFPEEEWHVEEQVRDNGSKNGERYTVKEGLRYMLPHPTRTIYDMRRPLTRINSDTGMKWGGTWYIRSYGDVLDTKLFWNKNKIFFGTQCLDDAYTNNYFREFFPCQAKLPIFHSGTLKREDKAAYYSSGNRDQGVFMTEFFMKIIPADWGLGAYENGKLVRTYQHPVWHRFTVAGDDTIVWAAPCAYNPMWFMGYDYDENCARTSSFALETIPWQDHLGNILSQIILTAKQNLANVTFYDNQIIDKDDIDRIKNLGEMRYRSQNFIGFDSQMRNVARQNMHDAIFSVRMEKQDITQMMQMLPMVISIMERVLQISAQEAGAAGPHQQSKAEIVQTGGASTNRVIYTSSQIDEGRDAWKKQLHDASIAYQDPEIEAEVSTDIENLDQHLLELGFKTIGKGQRTVLIRGNRKVIRLEAFAASNEGPDPSKEKEMAQVIFQVVGTIAGQPDLIKDIGSETILDLLERAAIMGGAPRDFKLRRKPQGANPADIPENIKQAIIQAQQATMQAITEKIAKPAAQEIAQDQASIQSMQQIVEQLKGIYDVANAQQDKNKIAQEKAVSGLRIKKDESDARIAIQQQVAQAEVSIKEMLAKAQIAIEGAKASHGAELAAKVAVAPKPPAGR